MRKKEIKLRSFLVKYLWLTEDEKKLVNEMLNWPICIPLIEKKELEKFKTLDVLWLITTDYDCGCYFVSLKCFE